MSKLSIFEFRNYTTAPGQRDVLIEMFERDFLEPQEALGAHVLATFRNLDDPDRFVWVRGFTDSAARFAALDGFYTSSIWRARREAANATIVDSDDVLLLKPQSGDLSRASPSQGHAAVFVVAAHFLKREQEAAFAGTFATEIAPRWREAGAEILATFTTEYGENIYPRLPVRQEPVLVSFARFESPEAARKAPKFDASVQVFQLQPTARSALR